MHVRKTCRRGWKEIGVRTVAETCTRLVAAGVTRLSATLRILTHPDRPKRDASCHTFSSFSPFATMPRKSSRRHPPCLSPLLRQVHVSSVTRWMNARDPWLITSLEVPHLGTLGMCILRWDRETPHARDRDRLQVRTVRMLGQYEPGLWCAAKE